MTAAVAAPALVVTESWLRDVVELMGVRASDPARALPELLGEDVPVIKSGRIELHPWLMRGDVTALVRWTAEVEAPSFHAYPAAGSGDRDVQVLGTLLGQPVRLCATTHRRVPGAPGLLTREQLDVVVEAEVRDMPSLAAWCSP